MISLTRRRTGPLTVFVHVPKAAGSTVNRQLRDWSRHGLDHAETLGPARLSRKLRSRDWVSGHLALNRFLARLGHIDRPLAIYGTIRDPVRHMAAQYNWQIEIFHRGKRFFAAHPPGIRAFSRRIRDTDNTDPMAVIGNLKHKPGLFLNLQSRFLLGDDITPDIDSERGAGRLARYAGITPTGQVAGLVERITGQPGIPVRENTSPYHFDPAVFDTPELRRFIARHSRYDIKLYRHLAG